MLLLNFIWEYSDISMIEGEFTGSEVLDAIDAEADDSFSTAPQIELNDQFAEIIHAQNLISPIDLSAPSKPQVTERHGAAFITRGAVGWVDFQVRDGFGTPAEAEANKKLEQLITAVKDERRSRLLVRVGSQAVLPYRIDPFQPNVIAKPFNKKHALQQGSMIELSKVYEDIVAHPGNYHERQPQPYVGHYTTFLPIAWIGRILAQEGELVLKLRDPK